MPPTRSASVHATVYPYGPFQVGGQLGTLGQHIGTVMLGLQNEREWMLFCEHVLLHPTLASDQLFRSTALRNDNRLVLQAIILDTFARLTLPQVTERLDRAPIANARMNTMADVWAHPQLQARERWTQVPSPAGELPALLPPGRQSAFDYRMGPIPRVGEYTEAILKELGLHI